MTGRESGVGSRKNGGRGTACRALDEAAITIWPEPSAAERQAILRALQQVTSQRAQEALPRVSVWAAAGREEAMLGRMARTREAWGRGVGRMADW